jgi:hypothetical protein
MAATGSKPFMQRVRHFISRPWRDQWLFVDAYILLGMARLTINTLKFGTLAKSLGVYGVETPVELPVEHLREARRIAWAVRTASQYTPWKSNCFPQAITAKYLLRRLGSTLYLGAAFKARTELEAHAWLRCGQFYVTGGAGYRHFGAVGIFG